MDRWIATAMVVTLLSCGAEVALATPKPARKPTTNTPCFSGPPLVASKVHAKLQRFSPMMHVYTGTKPLPSGRFGTCTVKQATVYRADGRKVAELGCGLMVHMRGLVDDNGIQVGATGKYVIARQGNAAARAVCMPFGKNESRCWFAKPLTDEQPLTRYTVTGALSKPVLRGKAALRFLARQRVVRYHVTVYCH